MRIIKIILKSIALLLLLAAIGIFVVIRYGSYEEHYRCDGRISGATNSPERTVFLKFQLHSPWLFWANTGGMAWSEIIPDQELEYYSEVQRVGNFLQFRSYNLKHYGGLSRLSNVLWLDTQKGRFEGACKRMEPDA